MRPEPAQVAVVGPQGGETDVDGRGALVGLVAQVVAVGADAQRRHRRHGERAGLVLAVPAGERLEGGAVARCRPLGAARGEQVLDELLEPQAGILGSSVVSSTQCQRCHGPPSSPSHPGSARRSYAKQKPPDLMRRIFSQPRRWMDGIAHCLRRRKRPRYIVQDPVNWPIWGRGRHAWAGGGAS